LPALPAAVGGKSPLGKKAARGCCALLAAALGAEAFAAAGEAAGLTPTQVKRTNSFFFFPLPLP